LANRAKVENWFPGFGGVDAAGREGGPFELYILGALRVLGRHHVFDDWEEAAFISESRHAAFFHEFIKVGSTTLFQEFVKAPRT